MNDRADDWLRQAENDLLWAEDTLRAGRFAQACSAAQQVAEKAREAVALARRIVEIALVELGRSP